MTRDIRSRSAEKAVQDARAGMLHSAGSTANVHRRRVPGDSRTNISVTLNNDFARNPPFFLRLLVHCHEIGKVRDVAD